MSSIASAESTSIAQASKPAFNPTDIPSSILFAWYDASDTSATNIVQSGGRVSQWSDKGSSGYHLTQGTAVDQPTTEAFTENGLNVLSAGGGQVMTATLPDVPADQDFYIFVVRQRTSDNECLYEFSDGPDPYDLRIADNSSSVFRKITPILEQDNTAFGTLDSFVLFQTTHINSVVGTSNEFNRYENGSTTPIMSETVYPVVGAFTGAHTFDTLWQFDDATGGNGLLGTIGEVIIMTSNIYNTDIENYMMGRWGIS